MGLISKVIYTLQDPQREKIGEEKGGKSLFKEMVDGNSPNLRMEIHIQIYEALID